MWEVEYKKRFLKELSRIPVDSPRAGCREAAHAPKGGGGAGFADSRSGSGRYAAGKTHVGIGKSVGSVRVSVDGDTGSSLRFYLGLGRAPLAAVDLQKLSGAEDGDTPKCPELAKMPIPGNQDVSSGLKGALEDAIVWLILLDDVNRFFGLNELCELPDACDGLSSSRGRPLELGKQDPFDLLKN